MTEEQLAKLNATTNEDQWNAVCDEVKAANGGKYPHDWFALVVLSGLMNRVSKSWARPPLSQR